MCAKDIYSNTTLVKVKFFVIQKEFPHQTYSNTTLVKVKLIQVQIKVLILQFKYNTC